MEMKTKALSFNGMTLTLVEHPTFGWGLPARMLGWALGYANEGQKLAEQLTKPRWTDIVAADCQTLTGEDLALLKAAAQVKGSLLKSNSLLFLTVAGVRKVLLKSGAKLAKDFRVYLAENGGEAVAGLGLAMKRPEGAAHPPMRSPERASDPLDDFKRLISWMRREGYPSDKLESYMARAVEQFLGRLGGSATPATQLALPAGLKFTMKGQPLEGDHPNCPGWLTAAEIGKPYQMSGTKIAHYIKDYCKSFGEDLPNNQAKKYTALHGGTVPVDDFGFSAFHVPKVQGYARWGTDTEGKALWRNVWGPDAVKAIKAAINAALASKGEPNPTQLGFPNMAPTA